ncbi:MAG: FixH family protein [Bacteroidia bacterium]|nr:FixH family protein [Bacteroidia bacterium]
MRRRTNPTYITALVVALVLSACKKKDKDDDHQHDHGGGSGGGGAIQMRWVELGHAHDRRDQYHADLYAEMPTGQTELTEGYYRFRVRIKRGHGPSDPIYTGTDVRFVSLMYMTGHTHSCPAEQPQGPAQDGFYYGAAFFQMPTTIQNNAETEPWKFHVFIGSDTVTFNIRVNPHPRGWVRRGRQFGNPANPSYLYEMKLPRLAVGTQDVSFYVYRRNMSRPATEPEGFPPVTNFTQIEVKTWMPSMGHDGGPGSQNATPVQGKPGRYDGKAAFNMTGDWWVIATFKEGETVIGRDTFAFEMR